MSKICDGLRASILQAAIQGRLTSRLPSDDDVEKNVMEYTGVNNRINNDYPEEWEFVAFGDIAELGMGKTILKTDLKVSGIPVYSATISDKPFGYIEKPTLTLKKGDIVIPARGNSIGWATLIKDDSATCTQTTIYCRNIRDFIKPSYLWICCYAFKNSWFKYEGSAIPQITVSMIKKLLVPIPSLAEQDRIIKKVDELMARVADLEKSADALASLKSHYPDEMRASLLQAAMQGKLTEQLSSDGSADELLQQIQAEKEKLVASGKIKKQKVLASITDDETPFSIPDNWKWVRLLNVCEEIGDIDHNMPKASASGGIPFLSAKDINDDFSLNFERSVKMISVEDYERLGRKMKPQEGDIIFSRIGSLGKTAIVDTNQKFLVSYSCCIMRPIMVDLRFFAYYLTCPIIQSHIRIAKTGIGVPDLGMGEIKACLMPLPPLSEQKRIVERLNEAMNNINVVAELIASE